DMDLAVLWQETGDRYTVYSGNYLNWIEQGGTDTTLSTRMKELQSVAANLVNSINGINIGLMRFSTNSQGGMVLQEMVPIETGRTEIVSAINSLSPSGGTPLSETLYEARQYYAGDAVDFGLNSVGADGSLLPSVPESHDNSDNYISPILLQCQRNYIVLLTDGLPVSDIDANDEILALPGFSENQGICEGNCLDDLAHYLNEVDQRIDGAFPDAQTIDTFTIGFHTDQQLLADAATGEVPVLDEDGEQVLDDDGNPVVRNGYFIANDREELENAFDAIIESIQTSAETFTSPSLSVDVQNRLTNRADVYFAMFEPASQGQPHWSGNLKKYRIGRPSSASSDSIPVILDADGRVAVSDEGVFVADAQSYWSSTQDGSEVTKGGFTGTLTSNRNVYTDISSGPLAADTNLVHEDNSALTAAMLAVDPAERDSLLQWARGLDDDGIARQEIGDPLHSKPTLVAYSGGTPEENNFALFFGTNDGMLHAIDPESQAPGIEDIEHFAFIPRELLPQLAALKRNAPQLPVNAQKAYGMDGAITVWIDEEVKNRVVDSGDHAYLFVGMRRGGRNYYALEVTDPDNPQLVWSIVGGAGEFVELGQSWSAPVASRIMWEGAEKQVLFFAGGNDTNQDSKDRPVAADDVGRAIYMVDALTGTRLWWASIREEADLTLADMTHSIPSDLRVIDTNQDGFDDRIYVGDTSAKVWRFDINNATEEITGGVFADLGAAEEAGNRRIYSAPSVTRIVDENFGAFLTVSVGTGHRAHPLEADVDDGFYMLRDINVFAPPINPVTNMVSYPDAITPANLLNVTDNVTPTVDHLETRKGWFIEFDTSEKSLSAPLTVLDRIFFTTYLPIPPPEPSCQPSTVLGSGRLYTVDILSGSPVNHGDSPVPDDRYDPLDRAGIPPSPTLVFTEPPCDDCDAGDQPVTDITMLVGTQAIDPLIDNFPRRTYWVQEGVDR
ncbi:MAG: PilC/PilY family type IV pilus protein, partial [Gammaproteobacteria bacterium]|nr:PilC/PilY family type IV pilus protein [Gammaproteobacteria bacterium]